MSKVAIITRTKDRPTFLKRAIDSIQSQKYKDYEHLIFNDAGDSSIIEKILEDLQDRSKIKVINRKKPSLGPDTIFNEAIDSTESEYVVIHDDDDTWHPDFLLKTVAHLDSNKKLAGVVVRTDNIQEEIDGKGKIKIIGKTQLMPELKVINLYRQCSVDNQLTPIAFLFRRAAYEDVGKFDDNLQVCGDWDFGIRLLQKYDVDFLDPGFALANYHHRKFKKDTEGNSIYAGNDKHRYYANYMMNKYLRQELAEGRLGVGYIMSSLIYERDQTNALIKKFVPKSVLKLLKK